MSDKGRCSSCSHFQRGPGMPSYCGNAQAPVVTVDTPALFGCILWTNPNYECAKRWDSLLTWMAEQSALNARVVDTYPRLHDFTWRGAAFTHCPFCGLSLDLKKPLFERHP